MDVGTRGEADLRRVPGDVRPRKLLLRALAGERTERPPIWLMRQAGRYLPEYHRVREAAGGMVGLCNSPEHAVEVTRRAWCLPGRSSSRLPQRRPMA